MMSSNASTFEMGGIVSCVDIGDRRSLILAHQVRQFLFSKRWSFISLQPLFELLLQGFVEALAGAEACAMVFHGCTELEGETNVPESVSHLEIMDRLSACFSGCIEV